MDPEQMDDMEAMMEEKMEDKMTAKSGKSIQEQLEE